MYILLIIVAIIVIRILVKRGEKMQLQKKRTEYGVPDTAVTLNYSGGSARLEAGKVFAWSDNAHVILTQHKNGNRLAIPYSSIRGIDLDTNVQTVTTGGGRSITGAVVGDVIAGPVGAIVGSRKKTKTKTIDRSTVRMRIANEQGIEVLIVFKGAQATYNALARLVDSTN